MKTLVVREFGVPPVMEFEERAKPEARAGKSLIRVKAASVNQLSNTIRSGLFAGTSAPLVLGNEGSGIVEQSAKFPQGTRVAIYGGSTLGVKEDGLLQEWVVVDDSAIVQLPENLTFEEGATLTINFLTAFQALNSVAKIKPGQTALISGATGSLGYACLQIAKALGASPIALVSSPEKAVKMFGTSGDPVINWTSGDVQSEVLKLTDGKGVDFAFDPVGGKLLDVLFKSLRFRGTLIALGFTGGKQPSFDLVDAVVAEKRIEGYALHAESDQAALDGLQSIVKLASEGKIKPVIDSSFDIADFSQAYDRLLSRDAAGSIVVTIS